MKVANNQQLKSIIILISNRVVCNCAQRSGYGNVGHFGAQTYHHAQAAAFVLVTNLSFYC
jgi:hypothetical protein